MNILRKRKFGLISNPDGDDKAHILKSIATGILPGRGNMPLFRKIVTNNLVDFTVTPLGWTIFAENYTKMFCESGGMRNQWTNLENEMRRKSTVVDSLCISSALMPISYSASCRSDNERVEKLIGKAHFIVTTNALYYVDLETGKLLEGKETLAPTFKPEAVDWLSEDENNFFAVYTRSNKMLLKCILFQAFPKRKYCSLEFSSSMRSAGEIIMKRHDCIFVKSGAGTEIKKFDVSTYSARDPDIFENLDIETLETLSLLPYNNIILDYLNDGFYIQNDPRRGISAYGVGDNALFEQESRIFQSDGNVRSSLPAEVKALEAERKVISFLDYFKIDFYRVDHGRVSLYWSISPPNEGRASSPIGVYQSRSGRNTKKVSYNDRDDISLEPIHYFWYARSLHSIMVVFNSKGGRFKLGIYGVEEKRLLKTYDVPGEWDLEHKHEFFSHSSYLAHSVIRGRRTTVYIYNLI